MIVLELSSHSFAGGTPMKSSRVFVLTCVLLGSLCISDNPFRNKACDTVNCPTVVCSDGSCNVEFVYCAGTCEGDNQCLRELGTCYTSPTHFCACGICLTPGYCE